jgi:hypothetical protein
MVWGCAGGDCLKESHVGPMPYGKQGAVVSAIAGHRGAGIPVDIVPCIPWSSVDSCV